MLKKYAAETKGRVKDRMMLIIKIKRDGMGIRKAAKSLGKSGSWGYKWYARYNQVGFKNLDDQPHTGRPLKVGKAVMKKIRKNACRKLIWTGKEMQDYIVKNSGLKYSITHVRYLIRRWGYSQKVPVGVHARRAPSEDRHAFQKEIAEIIQKNNDDGIVTAIQDETIVIAAPRARKRGYTRKKIRALYTYTGSRSKTIVLGLITTDGRSMFRQYDKFDMHAFAKFIRAAVRKFGKICLILDKAPQHRAKMILRLADEIEGLTLKFLPTATPEISAIETYWKNLKRKVRDVPYINLGMLRKAIAKYTRYTKPNLDVEKILQRSI